MTDDKGAGEGPYSVGRDGDTAWWAVSDAEGVLWRHEDMWTAVLIKQVANYAHAAGRKAERERCAKIADGYFHARGRVVAKAIRGGQDAK